jgi:hypothetical protein
MSGSAEISTNESGGVNVDMQFKEGTTEMLYRGTFTMNGGTISGNTPNPSRNAMGGVFVNGGIFTMSSGTIKGNKSAIGGGVVVMSPIAAGVTPAVFTMTGGTINGGNGSEPNTATGMPGYFEADKAGDAVLYMFTDMSSGATTYFYRDAALTGNNTMPSSASVSAPSGWEKGTMTIPTGGDDNN